MAVEAVASVVIEKLTVVIEKSFILDKLILDQVRREIRIAVRRLKWDAEEEKVIKFACDYLPILYQVEDVIETFALPRLQRKRRSSLWPIGCFLKHLWCHQGLLRKMLNLRIQIKQLNHEKSDSQSTGTSINNHISSSAPRLQQNGAAISQVGNEVKPTQVTTNSLIQRSSSTPSFKECWRRQPTLTFNKSFEEEGESSIVGFEEDVKRLVSRLQNTTTMQKKADERGGDPDAIISILGDVGSGKTTLAQAIYKYRGIKQWFECRAWVSVSRGYRHRDHRDVSLSILKQMGCLKDKDELLTPERLVESRLPEALKKMRYLIVLDDVWAGGVWEKLKHAFAGIRNGSKIIITTCNKAPALSADPHHVGLLSDSNSWKLFLNKARLPESTSIDNNLREKVLKKCKGLPLWIVLLGGLLSTKREPSWDEWYRICDVHSNGDILSLSYNDLPIHSKLCLLYLALFPREYDIPVRRLLRLWLAEGFVKRSSTMIPEDEYVDVDVDVDVVQEVFEDLVKRNMIQISKLRSDGSPRRCRLLGALHDNLLSKARAISLFHIHGSNSSDGNCGAAHHHPSSVSRIVEYIDIKNCNPSQPQNLQSYLSFNIKEKDTPAREVGQFVSKIIGNKGFGLLRVLDLEGVYKPSLPDNLEDLFHLRYLGLRWTFLDYLPSSVGDLPYLETLDVKHTNINNLPNSIWKLKQLRHLNLNEIRLDMPPHSSRLLTLWGLFVDNNSLVRDGLDRLRDLRELAITFHLSSSGQEDIASWVENLTGLQSLRLRSRDERGRPSELCLKPLLGLNKLSHLYLLGNLQKLPDINDFPPAVKLLTLPVSRLKDDPMPILGQLPNLTVLRLLGDSYLGKKIICPRQGFSKLRVLKLWMLKKLEEWDVEEGAMQSLKEVNIRCCHKLNSIPERLLQSGTLEELVLTNMPDKFREDVRLKITSRQTSLVVNNWDFTPLPWEQDI